MAPPRRLPTPPPAPSAPAGSRSGIGVTAGATARDAGPRTELGEFAPNALTGWNGLSRSLARALPADLHHSSNLVAAARRRLARHV